MPQDAISSPTPSPSPGPSASAGAPAAPPARITGTPLCDHLRASGAWNPLWEPFYTLDPGWTESFFDMATRPLRSGVLDPKTVEFLAIAVDAACTHMYGPGVRRHIRKALDLGATREEIAAVLQLTSVLGIHSMSLGAPILLEEIERAAQAQAAAPVTPAAPPAPASPGGQP